MTKDVRLWFIVALNFQAVRAAEVADLDAKRAAACGLTDAQHTKEPRCKFARVQA